MLSLPRFGRTLYEDSDWTIDLGSSTGSHVNPVDQTPQDHP